MINCRIWVMNAHVEKVAKKWHHFPTVFLQIPYIGGSRGEEPIRDQNHGV